MLLVVVLGISRVGAAPITYEFTAEEPLIPGNIVSVNTKANTAFKAKPDNIHLMYGVVAGDGNIVFTSQETADKVAVANSGILPVLASTASGNIEVGDPVTVKSIAGIGEKAAESGRIIGIAVDELKPDSENVQATTVEINGEMKEVHIGAINIRVGASDYTPNTTPINQGDARNRNTLEKLADNVTGKVVRPIGIVVAGLILMIGAFTAIFLITSTSYSSMISIGRNPLAEKKVVKSLIGLVLFAIGVFCVSAGLSYFALKLLG